MYPYNTNSNSDTTIAINNNDFNINQENSIKTDKRLEKIIRMAQKDVINLQEKYKSLIEIGMFSEDKNLLQAMYLDELKHEKELNEILYYLQDKTNKPSDLDDLNNMSTDLGVKKVIEELILLEMDNVNFYNTLAQSIPQDSENQIIIDILNSITCTKQTHGTGLAYLYAKYF